MGLLSLDRPEFYFLALSIVNIMNFIDRGIIPGATEEFTSFIDNTIGTSTPSLYIGMLQSSFIIGVCFASPVFATLAHKNNVFTLVGYGMSTWIVAAVISGMAFYARSYEVLIVGRILSGVGEAAFVCCTSPWIAINANPETKSTWLAIFATAMPLGTALGYVYSSVIATSIGWKWAFFIEAAYMVPFVVLLFVMARKFPMVQPGHRHFPAPPQSAASTPLLGRHASHDEASPEHGRPPSRSTSFVGEAVERRMSIEAALDPPSVWEETLKVLRYPCFIHITLGYAALTAVLIGLATFGSAFFLALDFFDTEVAASSAFGILVSIAGMIGFPLGGKLIDIYSRRRKNTNVLSREADLIASSGIMALFGTIGMLLFIVTYFSRERLFGMGTIFVATVALFVCNAATNVGLIYSIPIENRPFGIAFNCIWMHLLGDVPSPLVAGYLKDRLASGCVGDDDGVSTSDACRDDAGGIRLTMLLISLWLVWCTVFFGLSYRHALSLDRDYAQEAGLREGHKDSKVMSLRNEHSVDAGLTSA